MNIFEAIETRHSVRHFTGGPVTDETLDRILETGRRAPSGRNNQPWRFVVVRDSGIKNDIAQHTHYERVVREADMLVAVLMDNTAGYNRDKDMHSMGACIQNMWLAAHALGVGMCWNGEILNQREPVEKLLDTGPDLELMAVLCLGIPEPDKKIDTPRQPLEQLVLKRL